MFLLFLLVPPVRFLSTLSCHTTRTPWLMAHSWHDALGVVLAPPSKVHLELQPSVFSHAFRKFFQLLQGHVICDFLVFLGCLICIEVQPVRILFCTKLSLCLLPSSCRLCRIFFLTDPLSIHVNFWPDFKRCLSLPVNFTSLARSPVNPSVLNSVSFSVCERPVCHPVIKQSICANWAIGENWIEQLSAMHVVNSHHEGSTRDLFKFPSVRIWLPVLPVLWLNGVPREAAFQP